MQEDNKICTQCGVCKPLDEFFKSLQGKLGRKSICKSCTSARLKIKRDLIPKTPKPRNDIGKRKDYILEKCVNKHGDKFDYALVEFINTETPVEIFCNRHKVSFWQSLSNHSRKSVGCKTCVAEHIATVRTKTTEEVVKDLTLRYGEFYDYSKVVYNGSERKIEILCKSCGNNFWQRYSSHTMGVGCPTCCENGYNTSRPGSLYVLLCQNITKVGITNRRVTERVNEINRSSGKDFKVLFSCAFEDGRIPRKIEASLLGQLKSKYLQPIEVFDGHTECFLNVEMKYLLEEIDSIRQEIEEQFNDSNRPNNGHR